METCSFFGHRDTKQTEELKQKVKEIVERLIVEEGVDTFLFGSRSKFDELCHIVVTELQKTYLVGLPIFASTKQAVWWGQVRV